MSCVSLQMTQAQACPPCVLASCVSQVGESRTLIKPGPLPSPLNLLGHREAAGEDRKVTSIAGKWK